MIQLIHNIFLGRNHFTLSKHQFHGFKQKLNQLKGFFQISFFNNCMFPNWIFQNMIVHYCMSFLHVPKMHVPTLKCPNLHVPKPGLPKLQIGPSYVTGVNSKFCVFFENLCFWNWSSGKHGGIMQMTVGIDVFFQMGSKSKSVRSQNFALPNYIYNHHVYVLAILM